MPMTLDCGCVVHGDGTINAAHYRDDHQHLAENKRELLAALRELPPGIGCIPKGDLTRELKGRTGRITSMRALDHAAEQLRHDGEPVANIWGVGYRLEGGR